MKLSVFAVLLTFLLAPLRGQNLTGVRILLGTSDREATRWDGSLQVEGARLDGLEPWRFEGSDSISGSTWRLGTHPVRLFGGGTQVNGQQIRQIVANGVIARISGASDASSLHVTTPQGAFDVRLGEIPFGSSATKLNGRVFVDRVPATVRMTESPDEEDFPSAAAEKNGDYWVAYVSFRHHPDHDRLRARLKTPITDFGALKAAPGGDQIFARHYTAGKWQEPIAITGSGGDLYRTSIALDGRGRPWVFWSANQKGNFDIFARVIQGGKAGPTVQISRDVGPMSTRLLPRIRPAKSG